MPDSTPDNDREREAFERGRRRAYVDAELDAHEKHLNTINGTLERSTRQVETVKLAISGLREEVQELRALLDRRIAVEEDRVAQIRQANEKQISNRTFWLGVAAIIATVLIGVLAHGVHL